MKSRCAKGSTERSGVTETERTAKEEPMEVEWSWLRAHAMWRCYLTDGYRYCALLVVEEESAREHVRTEIERKVREAWVHRWGPLPEKNLSR